MPVSALRCPFWGFVSGIAEERERDKEEDTEEAGTAVPSTSAAAAACTARRVKERGMGL